MGFLYKAFNLFAVLSRAKALRRIRNGKCKIGSDGDVLPKLRKVHFVIRIRRSVTVDQIIGLFLIGDQIWNAFKEKIHVVGAAKSVSSERIGAILLDGFQKSRNRIDQVLTSAQRKASRLAGAF